MVWCRLTPGETVLWGWGTQSRHNVRQGTLNAYETPNTPGGYASFALTQIVIFSGADISTFTPIVFGLGNGRAEEGEAAMDIGAG